MKAPLVAISTAALLSMTAQAQGISTVDSLLHGHASMRDAADTAPHELTGIDAVNAYNRMVEIQRQVTQIAIDVYRMCMEQQLLIARQGQIPTTSCTVPTVPALAPLSWRDTPERSAK